jgi:Flp pilus assembly protein TadG
MDMRIKRQGLQQRRCRQAGVAAVEFALLLFVLLPILAGIIEFGRAMWYYDAVLKGTRDAARYLSAIPAAQLADATALTTATNIAVQASAAGGVPAFTSANVSISCAPTACTSIVLPGDVVQVTVSAQYPLGIGALLPFIGAAAAADGGYAVTLAPRTTMPYLW